MLTDAKTKQPRRSKAVPIEESAEMPAIADAVETIDLPNGTVVESGAAGATTADAGPVGDGLADAEGELTHAEAEPTTVVAVPKARSERPGGAEKVRGMNASLTTEAGTAGGLRERDPGRLHVTRRQIAFAVVLAVLAVIAAVLTFNAVSAGAAQYQGTVTTSQVYNLNFGATGTIAEVTVKVGDQVNAGQVIAKEVDSQLQSQVAADEGVVKADQAALAQAQSPQVTPAQLQQDQLQLQQAQTALTNARAALSSAEATGKAQVVSSQAALASAQQLAASDQVRYGQACPNGPVPPASGLSPAAAQVAESQYTHCQDLQLQLDKDTAAIPQDQAVLDDVQAQAQSEINSAQATLNSAQAAVNLAQYQQTLQSSNTNPTAVAQAQANLAQAQGQLTTAEQALQTASITAPSSGTVAAVYGASGDLVGPDGVHQYSAPSAGSTQNSTSFQLFPTASSPNGSGGQGSSFQPVVELVGGTQQVAAAVPESAVSNFSVGRSVNVSIPALGVQVTGNVAAVLLTPTRTGSSATYQVDITLSHTVPGLLPGMSASVRS